MKITSDKKTEVTVTIELSGTEAQTLRSMLLDLGNNHWSVLPAGWDDVPEVQRDLHEMLVPALSMCDKDDNVSSTTTFVPDLSTSTQYWKEDLT